MHAGTLLHKIAIFLLLPIRFKLSSISEKSYDVYFANRLCNKLLVVVHTISHRDPLGLVGLRLHTSVQ